MTIRENSKTFSFLIHTINTCAKCVITTFSFKLKDNLAFAEKKRETILKKWIKLEFENKLLQF